jgi:hypothetical protein
MAGFGWTFFSGIRKPASECRQCGCHKRSRMRTRERKEVDRSTGGVASPYMKVIWAARIGAYRESWYGFESKGTTKTRIRRRVLVLDMTANLGSGFPARPPHHQDRHLDFLTYVGNRSVPSVS